MSSKIFRHKGPNDFPDLVRNDHDKFLVTSGSNVSSTTKCKSGLVAEISDGMLRVAFNYLVMKTSSEMIQFLDKKKYSNWDWGLTNFCEGSIRKKWA